VKSNPNEYAEAQTKLCKYQNQSSLTTSGGRGPNYNCNAKPLLRLTADATALHASVNAMAANGNTNLLQGLMWGWRTISPNAPFADAKAYKTTDNEKIIILLTDGMNAWSSLGNHNKSVYSSFGYYTGGRLTDAGKPNPTNSTEARAQIDTKTRTDGLVASKVGSAFSAPSWSRMKPWRARRPPRLRTKPGDGTERVSRGFTIGWGRPGWTACTADGSANP